MAVKVESGFYVWQKGEQAPLSSHFATGEMECKCSYPECKEQRLSQELVRRLELVRAEYGAPIVINRGYSCKHHQADLLAHGFQAASPDTSPHPMGIAADIRARLMTALVPIVEKHFKAVGLARAWLHCDLRDDKERRWYYR